jgi:type II secretory pathway pseudopilin PulG
MDRDRKKEVLSIALVGFLALYLGAVAAGAIRNNPANSEHLIDKPIEEPRYDRGERCRDNPPRGMLAFQKWLGQNVRGETWGIMRCESWGGGNFSLHAEGRAIDWHLDARRAGEKRAAMNLIRTLIERDKRGNSTALARRMGVQGIIFNCKTWWAGSTGLGKYSPCFNENGEKKNHLDPTQAHVDHIHIELNWPGARKDTSFWKSPLAPRGLDGTSVQRTKLPAH